MNGYCLRDDGDTTSIYTPPKNSRIECPGAVSEPRGTNWFSVTVPNERHRGMLVTPWDGAGGWGLGHPDPQSFLPLPVTCEGGMFPSTHPRLFPRIPLRPSPPRVGSDRPGSIPPSFRTPGDAGDVTRRPVPQRGVHPPPQPEVCREPLPPCPLLPHSGNACTAGLRAGGRGGGSSANEGLREASGGSGRFFPIGVFVHLKHRSRGPLDLDSIRLPYTATDDRQRIHNTKGAGTPRLPPRHRQSVVGRVITCKHHRCLGPPHADSLDFF